MRRFMVRFLAVVGFLTLLLVGGFVALFLALAPDAPTVPDRVVLEFDFERTLFEKAPNDPVAALFGDDEPTLRDVVAAIDRAAADDRVRGLVGRVGDPTIGWAATQELRDAIARFRAAGKFTLVHAESFGDGGSGMQGYYLASAFEEVWMQPVGMVAVQGLVAELPAYRGTLEMLKIEPEIYKREEYKTAAEPFMEREATEANREMTGALINDLLDQWVGDVAEARGLEPSLVRAAVDAAPLIDREAMDRRLVDTLGYYDEMWDEALDRAHDGTVEPEGLSLLDYAGIAEDAVPADAPVVAVIAGSGPIMRGGGAPAGPFGEPTFGPSDIAEHFDRAVENPAVRAILFRVDSPGGSPVGSEVVRRAVQRARDAGKPVVVSMADVAGSGGYWVAMDADRIVAQPATLTGSIGVIYGKMVTNGLTEWAGVNTTRVQAGANAAIWSPQSAFSETERARIITMLDDIYDRFKQGVADGRSLPADTVAGIAKGRVYTGRQALEIGLVDALGGYDVAMDQIRDLIGVAPGAPVRAVLYPAPKSRFEQLMDLTAGDASMAVRQAVMGDTVAELRPLVRTVAPWLSMPSPEEGILLMRPVAVTGLGR